MWTVINEILKIVLTLGNNALYFKGSYQLDAHADDLGNDMICGIFKKML